jgi:hypothetical protein
MSAPDDDSDDGGARHARVALIALAVTWPCALAVAGAHLVAGAPLAIPAIVGAAVLAALVQSVRHASAVIARRSWSRPERATEVSRLARAVVLALELGFALVPVLGALVAFGFTSVTAQVDTPRGSYQYRVDYGPLRAPLRRAALVLCAASTLAAIALIAWMLARA